ncbi:zinc-binding dehydrogenase [Microtetraspora sp. AC03309]|uniref:quinone oxidoreductase family protein n=1 Tax=Microtetraspora sp. AC03309 TaxID=2779376 RepID=UPI001E549443|nr:zinc-binding dehydrogenase [Microtetraspora sp. AC03309]MCC5575856.1 zinc-binding dehydrogenase [Microtetraspora sp. AC03309]
MRRIRYHAYGGPEVLVMEEAEPPVPGPGQVRIRAEAIGANFVDVKFRQGPDTGGIYRRELPAVLTGDVVGTIDAVGPGVGPELVGRRVATLAEDAFADQVLADAEWLAPVPDGIDDATASMLPMGAPVALGALRTARLSPGETVLVHAATGGIGHLAVQLAKIAGATVIATAGSPAKLDFARALGADAAVDYSAADWPERVREIAPGGVDVVLDSVGGDVLRSSLDLLAPFGRAVVYGAASGEVTDIPVMSLFAVRSVTGFSLLAWRAAAPKQAREDMDEAARHAVEGRLRATLHARLPLTEAAEAHRILESRSQLGRVLLIP